MAVGGPNCRVRTVLAFGAELLRAAPITRSSCLRGRRPSEQIRDGNVEGLGQVEQPLIQQATAAKLNANQHISRHPGT